MLQKSTLKFFSSIQLIPCVRTKATRLGLGQTKHILTLKKTRCMSFEETAAKAAVDDGLSAKTIFDKIVSKEIPATIIHEDEVCIAFRDVSPQAPTHFLVIPKNKGQLTRLSSAVEKDKELLGHLMYVAQDVAKKEGLIEGFRVVINDGPQACQSVYHLHLHVMGGRPMRWPPG